MHQTKQRRRTELDRQTEAMNRLELAILSIFRRAREQGLPHAWILEQQEELFQSSDYKRLTSNRKLAVQRQTYILLHLTQQRDLDWRLWCDGQHWTHDEVKAQCKIDDRFYERVSLQNPPHDVKSNHFWTQANKPF